MTLVIWFQMVIRGRANAYGDLLNVNRIFNQFEANKVRVKGGSYKICSCW